MIRIIGFDPIQSKTRDRILIEHMANYTLYYYLLTANVLLCKGQKCVTNRLVLNMFKLPWNNLANIKDFFLLYSKSFEGIVQCFRKSLCSC